MAMHVALEGVNIWQTAMFVVDKLQLTHPAVRCVDIRHADRNARSLEGVYRRGVTQGCIVHLQQLPHLHSRVQDLEAGRRQWASKHLLLDNELRFWRELLRSQQPPQLCTHALDLQRTLDLYEN